MIKGNLKLLLLVVFIAVASCSFTTKSFKTENSDKDALLVDLISFVLERGHFDPIEIDEETSEFIYNSFIESMDPAKRFFLSSDLKEFDKYKANMKSLIKEKDFTFFNLAYSRFIERRQEVKSFYKEHLSSPIGFDLEEEINVDYDNVDFPNDTNELSDRWRKHVKLSVLETYLDKIDEDKAKQDKEEDYVAKSKKDLEKEARESVQNTLDDYFYFIEDLERKDYFAMYLNAYVEAYDPHTNYMAPQDKERFDTNMSGKLEGIGAQLQKTREFIKVTKVISGGPAWRGEHLEVGDMIMRVRQENEEESVDISAMRLDNAVDLIKGPKGTKVILTIKRVDGSIEDVAIVRDIVELEETYAKSSLIKDGDKTYGIVQVPQFYFNMVNYQERNAASDVEKEINRLKEEGVEGIILDLRDNGGGSLKAAIDMTGLFIEGGPVVQVVTSGKQTDVLRASARKVAWDGPLVVLINEVSASASEILAAAIQDYKRGVILGSERSYGKGTVQNVIVLNDYVRKMDVEDLGALKITTQKFYRINGGSTQLEGVKSDIVMPDRYRYIDIGEREYDNPLPYDKIPAARYAEWKNPIPIDEVKSRSQTRLAENPKSNIVNDYAMWIKELRDDKLVPLNYDKYKERLENRKDRNKEFDTINKFENRFDYQSLPYELEKMETDTTLAELRKRWHRSLKRDIYVEESIFVIEDLNKLNN